MSEESITKIELLSFEKESGKNSTAKFLNIGEVSWRLFIPSGLYTVLSVIITTVLAEYISNTLSAFLALVAYILLLFTVSWLVLTYRSNCSEGNFKLEKEHITAIFDVVLLINAAYLLLSGLSGDSNIAYNMCLINLTLYIGFAVSLDDLFDAKNFIGILRCFYSPFSKIKLNKKMWLIIGSVALSIVLFQKLCTYTTALIIISIIFIIILLSLISLDKFRKERLSNFSSELVTLFQKNKVLLLQIGTDYVVIKSIKNALDTQTEINEISQISVDKYNMIIVLNTLRKKEDYICYLNQITEVIEPDGVIIDPFITRKQKRSFLASWFGIPLFNYKIKGKQNYSKIFDR